MKKSLIAGAGIAALGLAVVPFAGVFAATTDVRVMTDTINVTVDPTCSFSKASESDTPSAHSYTEKLAANSEVTTVGTTKMVVVCNDAKGYGVTVTSVENLQGPEKQTSGTYETIPFKKAALTKGTAGWNAATTSTTINTNTKTETTYLDTGATVLSSTTMTPAAGDTATIKYDATTSTNQAAGTYTGDIVYTLAPVEPGFEE